MPRDGSGVYTKPFPSVIENTTIESVVYNGFTDDVALDLNTPRPIVAGGTGASSAATGLFNLSGEKAAQIVTSYDSHVWVPGSFRSAAAADGAPNATAEFSGTCYIHEALADPPTNQNVTVEARDASDGMVYIRTKTAGVWTDWKTERASISAAPLDAMAFTGMQVNGAMGISQENGTSTITATSGVSKYIVDGFYIYKVTGTTITGKQNVGAFVPGGMYRAYLTVQATTAMASVAAGDCVVVQQRIEGFRVAKLAWGSGVARPITVSFWIMSQNIGHGSLSVKNEAANRSYVADFVVDATSTWEYKTITIPGDQTGSWVRDNGAGMVLSWAFAAGTTFQTAANAWVAGNFLATPAQGNLMISTGIVSITGVTVFGGIEAPPAFHSPMLTRSADFEITYCKRYWSKLDAVTMRFFPTSTTTAWEQGIFWPVEMRIVPTVTLLTTGGASNLFAGYPQITSATTIGARYGIRPNAANVDTYVLLQVLSLDARMI